MCAWLTVVCIAPFAAVLWSPTRIPALRHPPRHRVHVPHHRPLQRHPCTVNFLTFPFAATLFLYSLLRSAAITLKNGGVEWRGTFYPLATLRDPPNKLP